MSQLDAMRDRFRQRLQLERQAAAQAMEERRRILSEERYKSTIASTQPKSMMPSLPAASRAQPPADSGRYKPQPPSSRTTGATHPMPARPPFDLDNEPTELMDGPLPRPSIPGVDMAETATSDKVTQPPPPVPHFGTRTAPSPANRYKAMTATNTDHHSGTDALASFKAGTTVSNMRSTSTASSHSGSAASSGRSSLPPIGRNSTSSLGSNGGVPGALQRASGTGATAARSLSAETSQAAPHSNRPPRSSLSHGQAAAPATQKPATVKSQTAASAGRSSEPRPPLPHGMTTSTPEKPKKKTPVAPSTAAPAASSSRRSLDKGSSKQTAESALAAFERQQEAEARAQRSQLEEDTGAQRQVKATVTRQRNAEAEERERRAEERRQRMKEREQAREEERQRRKAEKLSQEAEAAAAAEAAESGGTAPPPPSQKHQDVEKARAPPASFTAAPVRAQPAAHSARSSRPSAPAQRVKSPPLPAAASKTSAAGDTMEHDHDEDLDGAAAASPPPAARGSTATLRKASQASDRTGGGVAAPRAPPSPPLAAADASRADTTFSIDLDASVNVAPENARLVPCGLCGRTFAEDRLAKHERVCAKSQASKRKKFDMTKHRLDGLGSEAASFARNAQKTDKLYEKKARKSNWRAQHENFIAAIRAAKGDPSAAPPPSMPDPNLKPCPHCSRTFNPEAAARHIPICAKKSKDIARRR